MYIDKKKLRNTCLKNLFGVIVSTAAFSADTYFKRAVLQIGKSLVRSQLVSLEFFIDIKSFRSHCGPGVDSASNRNEYQELILEVKTVDA